MGTNALVTVGEDGLTAPQEQGNAVVGAETASAAATAQARSAVEAAYLVAMRNPRNWMTVRSKLLQACKRPRFAEVAIYSKPVGNGKTVDGLSIRFAEEAARAMGNLHTSTVVVFDDADRRHVQVTVTDLENNIARSLTLAFEKTVERKYLKKGQVPLSERVNSLGEKTFLVEATDDEVVTKQAAAVSKAERMLTVKHVPGDIQEEATEAIRATRESEVKADPQAAIKRVCDLFYAKGISADELGAFLGHPITQMNTAELDLLRSVYTAITEGESTWAEAVELRMGGSLQTAGESRAAAQKTGADRLKDRLAKGRRPAAPAPEEDEDAARLREDAELAEREGQGR